MKRLRRIIRWFERKYRPLSALVDARYEWDGIGLSEGLYVVLFGLVGVPPTEAVLLAVSARVIQILTALPWAIHYVMVRPNFATAPQN